MLSTLLTELAGATNKNHSERIINEHNKNDSSSNNEQVLVNSWLSQLLKCYNQVCNILRLFDGWENIPLTANETKHDY